MSTLYNALKKAEAERQKSTDPDKEKPAAVPVEKESSSPNVVIFVLVLAIIIVAGIAYLRITSALHVAGHSVVRVQAAPAGQAGVIGSLLKSPSTQSPYVLDGVIQSAGNSLAIINGKSLKVGDAIDDYIVVRILPKEVELMNSNDKTSLILKI